MRGLCLLLGALLPLYSQASVALDDSEDFTVKHAVDQMALESSVSISMQSSPSEVLADCALTYKVLSNMRSVSKGNSPDDKVFNALNFLKKSNYFERAYLLKARSAERATIFRESTVYRRLLESIEEKAVSVGGGAEGVKLKGELLDTLFAKDGECTFLIKNSVEVLGLLDDTPVGEVGK